MKSRTSHRFQWLALAYVLVSCDFEDASTSREQKGEDAAAASQDSDAAKTAPTTEPDLDDAGVVRDNPDKDGDGHESVEAGGDDCDDANPQRYGGNAETCDPLGLDEDCDLTTVAGSRQDEDPQNYDRNRDRDGDGAMNPRCVNIDPRSRKVFLATNAVYDCDDTTPLAHPGGLEVCDTIDNDCDGVTDEVDGTGVMFGLRRSYCRDQDGDGFTAYDTMVVDCGPPPFYFACSLDDPTRNDCDDNDPAVHPGDASHEYCDGRDNDCDGKVDQEDHDLELLPDQAAFGDATEVECRPNGWIITHCPDGFMWCNHETVIHGCETDVRRLETCRSCESTSCRFACGSDGCDEVRQIAVGYDHACAVTAEGRVACWGRGTEGRLGNDSLVSSSVPVLVNGLAGVVAVAAGAQHSCAIVGEDHALYCWGSNEFNQLDSPERDAYHPTPTSVVGVSEDRLRGVEKVALGREHSCAITTEEVVCWGEQTNGRLGDDASDATGPGSSRPVMRPVPGGLDFLTDATDIRAGDLHTCVLTESGEVECWGDNQYHQLGDPALSDKLCIAHANPVPGLSNVSQIAAGNYHTCALSNGHVLCWGLNDNLQLGRPSDSDDGIPRDVPELSDAREIAAGASFTCAVRVSGETICWGAGEFLGLEVMPISTHVIPNFAAHALAAGGFTCAIDDAHRASCWGLNFFGQLGLGSTSIDPVPAPSPLASLRTTN